MRYRKWNLSVDEKVSTQRTRQPLSIKTFGLTEQPGTRHLFNLKEYVKAEDIYYPLTRTLVDLGTVTNRKSANGQISSSEF